MIEKRIVHSISVMLLCWSAVLGQLAQDQGPGGATEVDFRVHRVGLGSSYALVLRRFGDPLSSKREKILSEDCGPPYTSLELKYNGALIVLMGDLRGRNFEVVSMEVTSPQLHISPGIKIGITEREARSKLGSPWQERNESGSHILNYVTKGNEGGAALHFVSGRLAKVQWNYTLC